MATVNELAQEFKMQPVELRAFADDLLDDVKFDNQEIHDVTEQIIREAIASAPSREI